jgi:hypothetical protein
MPKFPENKANLPTQWFFGVIFIGMLLTAFIANPMITAALMGLVGISIFIENRRRNKLAQSRPAESICTFARSFDRHKLDSNVVRAVYEEVNKYICGAVEFPLRVDDQLFDSKGLNLDPDDVDEILKAAAYRANKSIEHTEHNPFYDKVNTVADLVSFLMAQPANREVDTLSS